MSKNSKNTVESKIKMFTFLQESSIFQDPEVKKIEPKKAIFRMTMQTANDVNRNKRMYDHELLNDGILRCKNRMQRRAFYGELDHPVPTGEDRFDAIRQTTVLLKEVSHLIRGYEWRGNHLVGELETTQTPNGNILFGLLRDKSGLGLSMRGLANLQKLNEYNKVMPPLTIISFDSVSVPSHKQAVVNFNEIQFESHYLLENVVESNGLVCCGDKCFLPEYFDKLVENKTIKFFKNWV